MYPEFKKKKKNLRNIFTKTAFLGFSQYYAYEHKYYLQTQQRKTCFDHYNRNAKIKHGKHCCAVDRRCLR